MSSYRVFLQEEIRAFSPGKQVDLLSAYDAILGKLLDEQRSWLSLISGN